MSPEASIQFRRVALIFTVVAFSVLLLYAATDSIRPGSFSSNSSLASIFPSYLNSSSSPPDSTPELEEILKNASMDADIMWFRDPFPRFFPDADFQIACDHFLGRSDDMNNLPNGGFNYVKSNKRTIAFYKFWYSSREAYPEFHDKDVLNKIKFDPIVSNIGLKIRFLDTAYFGGLCEPSRDLNVVCTMHVNCCIGMDRKLIDLRIMLQDSRAFVSLPSDLKNQSIISWRVPRNCSLESVRHAGAP